METVTVLEDAPPECQCAECRAERAEREARPDKATFFCEHLEGCSKRFTGSVREYEEIKRAGGYYCCPKHRTSP